MLQFYFLSIMLNLVSGMILLYGKNFAEKGAAQARPGLNIFGEGSVFDDRTFRLVVGILTMFVGLMKLLSVVHNDVAVVGDLIPALAGLVCGFSLILEYVMSRTKEGLELPSFMRIVFVENRKYIGIFGIAAAVLHFTFPEVILL